MAAEGALLPLRTVQHPQHSAMWIVPGFAFPEFCIACAITRLGHSDEVVLMKKKILSEFTAVLKSEKGKAFTIFKDDSRAQRHLVFTVLDAVSQVPTEDLWVAGIDVLVAVSRPSPPSLVMDMLKTINQKLTPCSSGLVDQNATGWYLKSLSAILDLRRDVVKEFIAINSGVLDVVLGLLQRPDPAVVGGAVLVASQLLRDHQTQPLPSYFTDSVCACVRKLLLASKSTDLLCNLFSIVQVLLMVPSSAKDLLSTGAVAGRECNPLTSVFQRVLIGADWSLQSRGLECLQTVLTHHTSQAEGLLAEDLAELLFEGLRSADGKTEKRIYACLSVLTKQDSFYSGYHAVFGVEPITNSLKTAVRTRQWENACLGLDVLQTILVNQPPQMPLFPDNTLLKAVVELIESMLSCNVQTVNCKAITCLSSLMMQHHIPSSFSLQSFLPIIALCQYKHDSEMEPDQHLCTSTNSKANGEESSVPTEFCTIADRFFKVYLSREDVDQDGEIQSFVLQAFETSVVPYFLLSGTSTREKLYGNVLSLGASLLKHLNSSISRLLAKHLVIGGFIQLALDTKDVASFNKSETLTTVDQFLLLMCSQTAELLGQPEAEYCRDVLTPQVYRIRVSLLKAAHSSRVGDPSSQAVSGVKSLRTDFRMQQAVLCLLYIDAMHGNRLLEVEDLLELTCQLCQSSSYLAQLPVNNLRHLTFMVAVCESDVSPELPGYSRFQVAQQTLLSALSSLPDPSVTFSPHPTPLEWLVKHYTANSDLGPILMSWLSKLCKLGQESSDVEQFFSQGPHQFLVAMVMHWRQGLELLINMMLSGSEETRSIMSNILHKVVSSLAENSISHATAFDMASMLEKWLTTSQPIAEECQVCLLSVLSQVYCTASGLCGEGGRGGGSTTQGVLKVVHKIVNLVVRTLSHLEPTCQSPVEGGLVREALKVLYSLLYSCQGTPLSGVVLSYLTGNVAFLHCLTGLLPKTSKPKDHTVLSTLSILLCSAVVANTVPVENQRKDVPLSTVSLLSGLVSNSLHVQCAAMQMWSAIFASHGNTHPFMISAVSFGGLAQENKRQDHGKEDTLFALHFIIQNLVLSDVDSVSCQAATCLLLMYNHLKSSDSKIGDALLQQRWSGALLEYVRSRLVQNPAPPESHGTARPGAGAGAGAGGGAGRLAALADWIATGKSHPAVSFQLFMLPNLHELV